MRQRTRPSEMDPTAADRPARQRTVVLKLMLVATLMFTLAYGLLSTTTARISTDTKHALPARARAAHLASAMAPWDATRRRRARTLQLWARGDALPAAGDYNQAVQVLAVAYRGDTGNAELLGLFKRAQRIQSDETVRKAHLQHGHEGPGGTLRPSDIER